MIRTKEHDNEVSVFYPIDGNVYEKLKATGKNMDYIDKKTLEHFKIGFARTVASATNNSRKIPNFFINPLLKVKTGVIEGAPLATDF